MGQAPGTAAHGASLDAFRLQLVLDRAGLWVEYFALGGDASPDAFDRYLSGEGLLGIAQHNIIAVALNEQFMDRGLNNPVPYRN
ncbi:MAG: hypothetical protein M3N98_15725 [Actinomycetota bacterium]|nr:hypothetical protein [Actinomycetota bacterium]